MELILLDILEIIQNVDGPGKKTEESKGEKGLQNQREIKNVF
jgi:hypothetical protein